MSQNSPLLSASGRRSTAPNGDTNAVNLAATTGVAADRWRLMKDRQICLSSLGGVLLMIVHNCVMYYSDDEGAGWVKILSICVESALIISTLVSIGFLVQYYQNLLTLKQQEWANGLLKGKSVLQQVVAAKQAVGEKHSYTFVTSSLLPKFVMEVAVHLIMPYPWVPRHTFLYELLQILMFTRLYLVLRMLHTSSDAFLKRSRISAYYEEFRRMNLKIRWKLTLKMLFYDKPVLMTLYLLIVSLLVMAFCIFVLERDGQEEFALPANCLWFAFVTSSTIGYGDMVPATIAGKVIACCMGIMGHVIAAMFGGVLTNKLALSRNQQLISVFCDNQVAQGEYKEAAATLIQNVWREAKTNEEQIKKAMEKNKRGGSAAAALTALEKAETANPVLRILRVKDHKRNKIYGAVKDFRNRRQQLAKAQLMATDSVIDQKLDRLTETVESLVLLMNQSQLLVPNGVRGKAASFNMRPTHSSNELLPTCRSKRRNPTYLTNFNFPQPDGVMKSPSDQFIAPPGGVKPFSFRRGSSVGASPMLTPLLGNPLKGVGLEESMLSTEGEDDMSMDGRRARRKKKKKKPPVAVVAEDSQSECGCEVDLLVPGPVFSAAKRISSPVPKKRASKGKAQKSAFLTADDSNNSNSISPLHLPSQDHAAPKSFLAVPGVLPPDRSPPSNSTESVIDTTFAIPSPLLNGSMTVPQLFLREDGEDSL